MEILANRVDREALLCSGHPWAHGAGQSDGYSGVACNVEVTGHCLPCLCFLVWSASLLFSVL